MSGHTAGASGDDVDMTSAAAVAFQSLSAAVEAVGDSGRVRTSEQMIAEAVARKHEFIAALAMLASSLQELRSAGEYEALASIVAECRRYDGFFVRMSEQLSRVHLSTI